MPAHRQRRLFDDTKEAEKVLHFLSSLLPGEVVLHLMPLIIHAGLRRLEDSGKRGVRGHRSGLGVGFKDSAILITVLNMRVGTTSHTTFYTCRAKKTRKFR